MLLSTCRALFCSLIILNRTICFRLFNVSSETSMHCIVTFYNYPSENTLPWLRRWTEPFIYMTKITLSFYFTTANGQWLIATTIQVPRLTITAVLIRNIQYSTYTQKEKSKAQDRGHTGDSRNLSKIPLAEKCRLSGFIEFFTEWDNMKRVIFHYSCDLEKDLSRSSLALKERHRSSQKWRMTVCWVARHLRRTGFFYILCFS